MKNILVLLHPLSIVVCAALIIMFVAVLSDIKCNGDTPDECFDVQINYIRSSKVDTVSCYKYDLLFLTHHFYLCDTTQMQMNKSDVWVRRIK